jgi:hypothetical protein
VCCASVCGRAPGKVPLTGRLKTPVMSLHNNKPQVSDLGLRAGAGDGNRTRALSLGITVRICRVGLLTSMNCAHVILRAAALCPQLTGTCRPFWCASGARRGRAPRAESWIRGAHSPESTVDTRWWCQVTNWPLYRWMVPSARSSCLLHAHWVSEGTSPGRSASSARSRPLESTQYLVPNA